MRYLLVFFLVLCCGNVNAQGEAQGYYITLNSDTVSATYKLKTRPVFAFRSYDLFEEVHILSEAKETVKFRPADIKGFFIEWKGDQAFFVSMPLRNGKQKFFRVIALSPEVNIYGYSVSTNNGMINHFTLRNAEGSYLYVGPDDGNQKTKKRLKKFFEGQDNILSIMSAIKDLFTKPGFVQYDMERLIDKILAPYK